MNDTEFTRLLNELRESDWSSATQRLSEVVDKLTPEQIRMVHSVLDRLSQDD